MYGREFESGCPSAQRADGINLRRQGWRVLPLASPRRLVAFIAVFYSCRALRQMVDFGDGRRKFWGLWRWQVGFGWMALWVPRCARDETMWWWRNQLILLTGVSAWALMSLIVVLACAPRREPLDGLDRATACAQVAGIRPSLALLLRAAAVAQPAGGLGGAPSAAAARTGGSAPSPPGREMGNGRVVPRGHVVITLWQRFPYRSGATCTSRVGRWVYLVLAFHAVVLTPPAWRAQYLLRWVDVRWWGVIAPMRSLAGAIGRNHRHAAHGERVAPGATCDAGGDLPGPPARAWRHTAGAVCVCHVWQSRGAQPFTC